MNEKPVILVVDGNRTSRETLVQHLGQEGYTVIAAASFEEMDTAIKKEKLISLALIDISGFDQQIWDRCDQLAEAGIPFIIIAPQRSPTIQKESLSHGASGVLLEQLNIKELLEHINIMLGG